jgi:hypothetical protein
MSETTSRGHRETNQREDREDTVTAGGPRTTRRRWVATVVILVVLGAGAGAARAAGAFGSKGSSGESTGAPPRRRTP